MKKLMMTLVLLLTSVAFGDGYQSRNGYYWKGGQRYTREAYRCWYKHPVGCCGNWVKRYKTCYKYKLAPVVVSKDTDLADIVSQFASITRDRQTMLRDERKQILIAKLSREMAELFDIPIELEGGVPQIDYGFKYQNVGQYQALQSQYAAAPTIGQYAQSHSILNWNPDSDYLLMNRFANTADRIADLHGEAFSSMKELSGDASGRVDRIVKYAEEAGLIREETDRLRVAAEAILGLTESSKARFSKETQSASGGSAEMPKGETVSLVAKHCLKCHQGEKAERGFRLDQSLTNDQMKLARYAIRLGTGEIDAAFVKAKVGRDVEAMPKGVNLERPVALELIEELESMVK